MVTPDLQARSFNEAVDLRVYALEAGAFLKHCRDLLEPSTSKEYQINVGLLTKAIKIYESIDRNLADSFTLAILRRVLLETCLTLTYLIKSEGDEAYDAFISGNTLRRRNLLQFVERSGAGLGPISDQIAKEIRQGFKRDGIKEKDIPKKPKYPKSWHPDMRIEEIAHSLGSLGEHWFATSYAYDSEVVHPSWEDIVTRHLTPGPDGDVLIPNLNTSLVRPTTVEEIICWIFDTAYAYIEKYDPQDETRLNALAHMHKKLHEPVLKQFNKIASEKDTQPTAKGL